MNVKSQAYLSTRSSCLSENWLLDSGASHHITLDLQNLTIHSEYNGGGDIIVGNGNNIPITHTGSFMLNTSSAGSFLHLTMFCVLLKLKETCYLFLNFVKPILHPLNFFHLTLW